MPVKPTSSENEQDFIGRCMSEEKDSFPDNTQRYAVCKSKWDESLSELAEHETEPELENLPDVQSSETEDSYLERCIPTLYPEKYDQRIAASYCADHYQKKVTVSELKKAKLSIMKSKPLSDFDRKKMEFMDKLIELKEKGIYIG